MPARLPLTAACVLASGGAFYLVGLATGAVSAVGYESRAERSNGFIGSRPYAIALGAKPVWLPAGGALRADYEVEAAFGSVALNVAPPLLLRTTYRVATAYVEGARKGSVLFVAQAAGWHSFWADSSALGGPRCPGEPRLVDIFVGRADCPAYDVAYKVVWRLADPTREDGRTARLNVPRPDEKVARIRIP